ncbi:DUF11 domain-containing protein [Amycolatopsis rhizosphaerae]|uniref:DUF11 domain-containing protein n=1 Tax=Amycolatopsis rhizosphaerae TaxID=2053003 RepID=UPI001FEA73D2|nr:DUF11 domain-containing protein [Amycolatopsis rhizosphaerae]
MVTDSTGTPVKGYALVGADAENTSTAERITWTADQPIAQVASIPGTNGCQASTTTGLGTTTVSCTGTGPTQAGDTWGTEIVQAVGATTFSQTLYENVGREAVAFAIQTSKLTLNKVVSGRVRGSDSFDLSVTSPEGTTVGSATTGSAATATTGTLTVLPRANGSSYVLGEAASAGSSLASYSQSWSCTNATTGSTTTLPSGPGTVKAVSPLPGDDISCTVTNSPLPADLGIVKMVSPSPVRQGDPVTYTLVVTNHGQGDSSGYTVTDQVPAQITNLQTTTPGCTLAGSNLSCAGGLLPAGQSATITVTGVATGPIGYVTNTATLTGNQPDPNPTNNSSGNTVEIVDVPVLPIGLAAGVVGLSGLGFGLRRRNRHSAS